VDAQMIPPGPAEVDAQMGLPGPAEVEMSPHLAFEEPQREVVLLVSSLLEARRILEVPSWWIDHGEQVAGEPSPWASLLPRQPFRHCGGQDLMVPAQASAAGLAQTMVPTPSLKAFAAAFALAALKMKWPFFLPAVVHARRGKAWVSLRPAPVSLALCLRRSCWEVLALLVPVQVSVAPLVEMLVPILCVEASSAACLELADEVERAICSHQPSLVLARQNVEAAGVHRQDVEASVVLTQLQAMWEVSSDLPGYLRPPHYQEPLDESLYGYLKELEVKEGELHLWNPPSDAN